HGRQITSHAPVLAAIGREITETFFWPSVVVLLGAMFLKPVLWGRPRVRLVVVIWGGLWLVIMVALLRWPGKEYLDGRHTLPLEFMLYGLLALALMVWERPMRWWMAWWRRRPERWARLPAWMTLRQWPRVCAGTVMGLMLIPGMVQLRVPPR